MKVEEACEKSLNNRNDIHSGIKCGCYFCMSVVDGGEIVDWEGDTAICLTCGVDSIVVGVEDKEVLGEMYDRWFGKGVEKGE